MLSDDFGHLAVGAVRVDDAEVAVFPDPEAAGIPPEEDSVCAAVDEHPVELPVGVRLHLKSVGRVRHSADVPRADAGLRPEHRLLGSRPACVLIYEPARTHAFPRADAAVCLRREDVHSRS